MANIDDFRQGIDEANAAAQAKIAEAIALTGAAQQAAFQEAQRLSAQAVKLNKLLLEWQEGRLASVVAALERMVVEERAAQSSIRARIAGLAGSARESAGIPPVTPQQPDPSPQPAPPSGTVAVVPPPPPIAPVRTAPPPVPPAPAAAPANPDVRDTELEKLHPTVRGKVAKLIKDLAAAKVPMKVFKATRSPERQRMLFNKGRSGGVVVDSSKVVTNADAWHSYHQYGLAVDMVIDKPGVNPWETTGEAAAWWTKYHEIARKHGLEPLSFEMPHIQITGTKASSLLSGSYPDGGDAAWETALTEAINRWPGQPKPPLPGGERPPVAATHAASGAPTATIDWSVLPPVVDSPMTSMFGGQSWRVDRDGVYLAGMPDAPQRTPGAPLTTGRIVELHGVEIADASALYGIAPELLVMTIATEAGLLRDEGFTGPKSFRWESGFLVRRTGDAAVDGKEKGDYSAGPMQVMADTARGLNIDAALGYDNARDFPFFKNKPANNPKKLGLYDAAIGIDIGACYIKRQIGTTDGNPILVAAGYNAGSLRASGTNAWGIHVHGDHLDRAAKWFGDACAVLRALGR